MTSHRDRPRVRDSDRDTTCPLSRLSRSPRSAERYKALHCHACHACHAPQICIAPPPRSVEGHRLNVTLRQPSPIEVELAVTVNGATAVYPLNLNQLKLLASQAVRAVCNWRSVP